MNKKQILIERFWIISPLIEQKVKEFRDNYSNKFADIFCFLMLKKIICSKCNKIIEEKVDIEFDYEFNDKLSIKEISNEKIKLYNYNNNDKNMKFCKNCYTMASNLMEEKSILNAPSIFIVHFENKMKFMIDNIEINEILTNTKIKYYLFSIILVEELSNNDYRYNVCVLNENLKVWNYFEENNSLVLSSEQLIDKINLGEVYICTGFYKK